ncbi:hypothetical protein [Anaerobium acetethylicum]|uniref:hypothetical protein n=1 Tax=Anaerobium acetethylicum TaxID=1619234 RepID=UPI000B82BBFB|nr:hypothetical protein [Anaerobium acetethylicum]
MNKELTNIQKAAYKLIQSDATFIRSLIQTGSQIKSNYIVMSFPYLGIYADGAEQWGRKVGLNSPIFNDEERFFYTQIRQMHKLYDMSFRQFADKTYDALQVSDEHFSSICKPIAKWLKVYDNYGVDLYRSQVCGNTVMCQMYVSPLNENAYMLDGEKLCKISVVAGKLCAFYGGRQVQSLCADDVQAYRTKDYHFPAHTPIKHKSKEAFALFSVLCSINYVLYLVDKIIKEEMPTKIRIAYLEYYYLTKIISEINQIFGTYFMLSKEWVSAPVRNCMAHYGLGQLITESELDNTDLMFGITKKYFGLDYYEMKEKLYSELKALSVQIEDYLF